jgi:hypothetical protein
VKSVYLTKELKMKKLSSMILASAVALSVAMQPVASQAGLLKDIKNGVVGTVKGGTHLIIDGGKLVVKGTAKVVRVGAGFVVDGVDFIIEFVEEPVEMVAEGLKDAVVGTFKGGKLLIKKTFKGTLKITKKVVEKVRKVIGIAYEHGLKPTAIVMYKGTLWVVTAPIKVIGEIHEEIHELPIFEVNSDEEFEKVMQETAGDDAQAVEVK